MLKHLTDFFKSVFIRKAPQQPLSWKDILKDEQALITPLKRRRTMLLPSNRILLWKTEAPVQKKKIQTGLNFMFQFNHGEEHFVIKTQRAFEQKLVDEALPKISALMRKKSRTEASEEDISMQLAAEFENFKDINLKTTLEFADDKRISKLLVNGSEFEVIRNGIPISTVSITLTPIVGQFCMPTIAYNIKGTRVQLHWFVKDQKETGKSEKLGPTQKDNDSLKLAFEDEAARTFKLHGYSFRHSGPYFQPDEKDVSRLVAVVVESGKDHPAYAAISSRPISQLHDEVITDEQVKWCEEISLEDDSTIRIMSYNILADLYLNLTLPQEQLFFNYCQKSSQRIIYRTPIFLKQLHDFIHSARCSLIFLQEVDLSRHENFIVPFLNTISYSSEIAKKVGTVSEGVAIIFDSQRFQVISSKCYGVAELASGDILGILETSEESKERFSTRPTVLQIVVLKDSRTGKLLVCGNTHLHHNPIDEHVKVLQALTCTRKLLEIYEETRELNKGIEVLVLFGGDFNSTPNGAVFNLMSMGNLPKEDAVWNCDSKITPQDIKIDKKMDCLTGTPEYTNYTANSQKDGFVGCLDYIWGVGATSIRHCPLPSHEKVIKYTALPSPISPSDHLPIICDIKI